MFMEEEHIFNPHQSPTLPDTTKEPVDDSGAKIGGEASGCGTPDAGSYHDALEDKYHRPSTKVIGESNNE